MWFNRFFNEHTLDFRPLWNWFKWRKSPRPKPWGTWSRWVLTTMWLFGNQISPFQLAGQIHAQKVKGMNCHLAKLTTPMLCQVHKIYQPPGERNNDLTSIFQRFQSGFVPLLLWGILPWCDMQTSGLPPVLLRKGSFNSPRRYFCLKWIK